MEIPKGVFTVKDLVRFHVIQLALQKKISNAQGTSQLGLSVRQFIRLKKKVLQKGPQALLHGNRGHKPVNAFPEDTKQKVLDLYLSKYRNFNLSHFADMLQEKEGLQLSRETVRRWLREAGLLPPPKKRFQRRKRRNHVPKEGQMVFLDGSLHHWFGDKPYTLILALDDVTGKLLYGKFFKRESLKAYFEVCYHLFRKYGLPESFYLDRHSVFITTRHEGVHVKQTGGKPTHFQITMAKLGIDLIFAHCPQACGRIERSFATLQDRLLKELVLEGISDPEQASRYFNQVFIPRYTKKFAVEPKDPGAAWRPSPNNLKEMLCKSFIRKVKNDLTISVEGRILQLKPKKFFARLSGRKVEVKEFFRWDP